MKLAAAILAASVLLPCYGAEKRSSKPLTAFKRENPCPATGKPSGPCPGWVMDHIVPLCAGGRDEPWNLQWQTVEDAKAKDRIERQACKR